MLGRGRESLTVCVCSFSVFMVVLCVCVGPDPLVGFSLNDELAMEKIKRGSTISVHNLSLSFFLLAIIYSFPLPPPPPPTQVFSLNAVTPVRGSKNTSTPCRKIF